jgi:hypothetical protein
MSSARLKLHHLIIALLLVLQAYFTISAFAGYKDLLSPEPILNVDWCSQYYWSHAARSFHEASGRIWGFDPYYMAGYPLDFVFNSSLPVQLISLAMPFLSIGHAIKIFYLLTFILVPLFLYLSMKNFGMSALQAIATASLGTVYFWLAEDALFGQWGMLSGSFILNFFLFPLSLLCRFLQGDNKGAAIGLFIALPIAILIHKTALVLIPFPFIIMLASFRGKLNSRNIITLALLAAWTFFINAFWLIPFFHFMHFKIEDPVTTFFQNTDPLRFFKDLFPVQEYYAIPLGRLLMMGLAAYGAVSVWRIREKRQGFWFFILAGAFFFLVTYLGSFSELVRHIQPYRYVTGFYFMLLPLSGFGLARAFQWKKNITPAAFIVILILLMVLPSWRYFPSVSPLRSSFPQELEQLLEWLERNTDRSARLMIEDNNIWESKSLPYGATRFPGILPALIQRELVGGPLPNAFIRHHHVHFHDGRFLGRELRDCDDDWLKDRIRLYNIRWAVCWSEASKSRLGSLRGFAGESAVFSHIKVFEFDYEQSFFLKGDGKIHTDYDRIELSGLRPDEDMIVIKYHYMEGFRTEPEAEIFRFDVPGDPVGYIGIRHPGPGLTLTYSPFRWFR